MAGKGRFEPHRSPEMDARVRKIETYLAAIGAVIVPAMTTAQGAKNTGAAISASGGGSSGGGGGVLAGDVTGPIAANQATNCVILTPGTPGRNTVQPTADNVEGLSILNSSLNRSVSLLAVGTAPVGHQTVTIKSIQNDTTLLALHNNTDGITDNSDYIDAIDSGGNFVFSVDNQGTFNLTPQNPVPCLHLVNTGTGAPVMDALVGIETVFIISGHGQTRLRPSDDGTAALLVAGHSATQALPIFEVIDVYPGTTAIYLQVQPGGLQQDLLKDATTNVLSDALVLDHQTTGTPAANWGHTQRFTGQSSTTTGRSMAQIDTLWATATDATRKARIVISAWDTAAREGLRIEASGSAPMAGFLGAAAIVRQGATTDFLQDFINFGFKTGGGPTPLNLLGGTLTAATIVGDCTGAVTLTPGTSARNTVQPTADNVTPLTGQAHSSGNTSPLLQSFTDPTQAFGAVIDADGNLKVTARASVNPLIWLIANATGPTTPFLMVYNNSGAAGAGQYSINNAGSWGWDIRTSTTLRTAANIQALWDDPTDATRHSGIVFTTRDTVAFQQALHLGAGGPGATIGFLGTTPVPRAAAYTLSGSATRTFPTDPSSAYTGIASGVGGTPYAQVSDLNTLRTAVSTLIGIVRQGWTDLGSSSGFGLLNA